MEVNNTCRHGFRADSRHRFCDCFGDRDGWWSVIRSLISWEGKTSAKVLAERNACARLVHEELVRCKGTEAMMRLQMAWQAILARP